MNKKTILSIMLIIVLVALVLFLVLGGFDKIFANNSETVESDGSVSGIAPGLYMSEIVSSNQYTITLDDGSTPDYIEIFNNTEDTINLSGYGLTDDALDRYKFQFPSVAVNPGEYYVVLCTSDANTNIEKGYLSTGFKLSSTNGEHIVLSAPEDKTVQALEVPTLDPDIAYGITETGSYAYFGLPTPGAPNSGIYNETGDFTEGVIDSDIIINEYMIDNSYSILDEDGERYEWVEIKNTGTQPVNIGGYALSDDETNPKKWLFPDMTLESGEIRVIFLSGKDRRDPESNLHTNFKIGSDDLKLVLSQELGKSIDVSVIDHGMGTASCGRSLTTDGAWLYYAEATPGAENTTKGFEKISESIESYLSDVYISETKTNAAAKTSNDPDWIEIANKGTEAVNLNGYGLSDSKDEPFRYVFGDVSIAPGEFKVVYVGKDATGDDAAYDISLSASGEDIYLSKPDGCIVDYMNTGVQYPGMSSGRLKTADERTKYYFTAATPGSPNSDLTFKTYTQKPVYSQVGGYVDSGTLITITSDADATIYYTTDGSKPTVSSTVYSGPIQIGKTTTLRSIAVSSGKLTSECTTENYLVEEKHDIPVLCISGNHDELFGHENGILVRGPGYDQEEEGVIHKGANYWVLGDVEREISFEWFEADGTKGIEFPAGLRMFGSYSREEDQKSVAIFMRGAYGVSQVTYPFFRDYDVTTFSSLVLRTSGQDWNSTKIRDAAFTQIVKDEMDLDYMEYRPCAVYINGEYWGLYNLREKQNEDYVVSHYPETAEKGKIDIIKGNSILQAGSVQNLKDLRTWVQNHDLSVPENYEEFCKVFDVESYMDYIIVETFFNNTDSGNIRYWRDQNTGVWRLMLFDLDWGISPTTYHWNYIEEYFNPEGHGMGSNFFTTFSVGLMKNPEWRQAFIERYAYHLTHTFNPDRMDAYIDAMADEIATEIPRQQARWGAPKNWEGQVGRLKSMLRERVDIVTEDLQEFFGISNSEMQRLGLK